MDWFLYDNGLRHERFNNLEDILKAFEYHPSIEKIKKAINITEKFFLVMQKMIKCESLL